MAGAIINPKRPRYQSNERFDTVDADQASRAPRVHDIALTRHLLSTPRATAAVPTGLIVNGFTLTLNPVPADGTVRINTEASVAIDADGNTLVKPVGTTIDTIIPATAAPHQLYIYFVEDATDNAKRRFIPATSPYTEFTQAINTAFQGTVATYVRAGGAGSIIAEDAVNGQTVPLVCIGIVTNTAGTITCTGYNAVTAPNGSDIINRLTAVTAPSVIPTTNTRNGSPQTIHDVITAALYVIGQSAWLGSDFLTPVAGNNFGAYSAPAGGVDKAFRQTLNAITIGNGTSIFGDFNTSNYANNNAMLVAALAALPAAGGRIYIKQGVTLTGFNSATVALPAGKTVEIIGDHMDVPTTTPQFTFVAGEGLVCSATGKLILRNLHIRHASTCIALTTSPCVIRDVYGENTALVDAGAFLQGVNVNDLDVENLLTTTVFTTSSTGAMQLRVTGIGHRISMKKVTHSITTGATRGCMGWLITDAREDIIFEHVKWLNIGGLTFVGGGTYLKLDTTDNVTDFANRRISGYSVPTDTSITTPPALGTGNLGHLLVEDFDHQGSGFQFASNGVTVAGPVRWKRWRNSSTLSQGIQFSGVIPDLVIEESWFEAFNFQIGNSTSTLGTAIIRNCRFQGTASAIPYPSIIANTLVEGAYEGCTFDSLNNIFAAFSSFLSPISIVCSGATGSAQIARFSGNTITNFQNVTYGAAAAFIPTIFSIRADYVREVIVENNRGTNICSAVAGAFANKAACFVLLTSKNGTSDAGLVWTSVVVRDNVVGHYDDYCTLLRTKFCFAENYLITGNQQMLRWDTTLNRPQYLSSFLVSCEWSVIGVIVRTFVISNNTLNLFNISGSAIFQAWIFTESGVDNLDVHVYVLEGNHLASTTSNGFTVAGSCNETIKNLTVLGNTASRDSASGASWAPFFFSGTVTRSNPALPGAGVPFANNNLIHQG